jgi:hypothetical protein
LLSAFAAGVFVEAAMLTDASCLLQPTSAAANTTGRRIFCIAVTLLMLSARSER